MSVSSVVSKSARISLPRLLSVILLSRLVINSAFRMGYAFTPQLSEGLGISLQQMANLLGIRSGIGLLAPFGGALSDRYGRRILMIGALSLLIVSAMLSYTFASFVPFVIGFIGLGLAKVLFDPSAAAYLGDETPYERRGLVMGLSELGWASGALIGAPLIGLAMDRWGWQAPLVWIAASGVGALGWAWFALPSAEASHQVARIDWREALRTIAQNRSAIWILVVLTILVVAGDMLFVTYAAWLKQAFALDVISLGSVAAILALAEVGGELLSMWIVDRTGKKRALAWGFIFTALFFFVMPVLGASLPIAILVLFAYFVSVEFTIVSAFPLISELSPRARGTMMSLVVMVESLGRVFGASFGAWLFGWQGFGVNSVVAGVLIVVAVLLLTWGVQEQHGRA